MQDAKVVDEIERALAITSGQLNVAHGQLVDLVARAIATRSWEGVGIKSPAHWLSLRSGLSRDRAQQIVLLAQRVDELPLTIGALREGRLSVDQAYVVARRAPSYADRDALDLALYASVSQLWHVMRRFVFDPPYAPAPADDDRVVDDRPRNGDDGDDFGDPDARQGRTDPPDGTSDDAAGSPASAPMPVSLTPGSLSYWFDENGRFQLRVDAPMGDGLIIEAALREARDALFQAGLRDVTWLDALLEMCRRSTASNHITGIGSSRLDRYRIYVHLDTEGAWVQSTVPVPPALRDQFMCDGVVTPVWTTGGRPVNLGRTARVVSPTLRRLVMHRDGHRCRTSGCDSTLGLEVHHIVHYGHPHNGPTDTWNLVVACGGCHTLIHQGEMVVTGNADEPDGLTYTDRKGRPLIRYPTPIVPDEPLPMPDQPYTGPTGEPCYLRWITFNPPRRSAPTAEPDPAAADPPSADAA